MPRFMQVCDSSMWLLFAGHDRLIATAENETDQRKKNMEDAY